MINNKLKMRSKKLGVIFLIVIFWNIWISMLESIKFYNLKMLISWEIQIIIPSCLMRKACCLREVLIIGSFLFSIVLVKIYLTSQERHSGMLNHFHIWDARFVSDGNIVKFILLQKVLNKILLKLKILKSYFIFKKFMV